jgi:cytochrome c
MRYIALIAVALASPFSVAQAQDIAAGETVFKQCRACHQIGANARNVVGPILNGLDGRKSGTIEGYSYSEPNKNSGITWNDGSFKEYIKNPMAKIPGTKMSFVGLKNEKDVVNLWAFLKQYKADGGKN